MSAFTFTRLFLFFLVFLLYFSTECKTTFDTSAEAVRLWGGCRESGVGTSVRDPPDFVEEAEHRLHSLVADGRAGGRPPAASFTSSSEEKRPRCEMPHVIVRLLTALQSPQCRLCEEPSGLVFFWGKVYCLNTVSHPSLGGGQGGCV